MSVCIDSNFLIWGVKKQASPTQEDMKEKAALFFEQSRLDKVDLLIPTAVITEILAPEPLEKHQEILKIISRGFIIADYDLRVAQKSAELIFKKISDLKAYCDENNLARDKMKFDHVIVATAIVYGCTCVYSDDPHIRKLCNGLINYEGMPDIKKQPKILEYVQMDLLGEPLKLKTAPPRKKR